MTRSAGWMLMVAAAATIAGCGGNEGVSTADVERAAEERVRQSLGLSNESALFSNVFVGAEVKGDRTLCGTVAGKRADGTEIPPRRFIAAIEPARWLVFEPADNPALQSQPDKFVEWQQACGPREREG